jgi:hypothetical protein
MKNIIIFIGITLFGINAAVAQTSNNDPQISINNYKHTNKAIKAARTDIHQNLTVQEASLRSQRTNKIIKRDYVLAPSNSATTANVQGRKTKANYKNQF